jgi:S1-C subfamily serine protease
VNLRVEVIGVNSANDVRAQGIGFAIPIDNVKEILPQLEGPMGAQEHSGKSKGYVSKIKDLALEYGYIEKFVSEEKGVVRRSSY